MFSRYEINFIAMFKSPTRMELVDDLEYLITALTDKGTEFYRLTQSILIKLREISDDDFNALDLRPDFQEAMKVKETLGALDELEDPEDCEDWEEVEDWEDQEELEETDEIREIKERVPAMFTPFEINLMSVIDSTTRISLISGLEELLSCLADTETDLYSLIHTTLAKLEEISDETFSVIDLNPDWQEDWELADTLKALLEEW